MREDPLIPLRVTRLSMISLVFHPRRVNLLKEAKNRKKEEMAHLRRRQNIFTGIKVSH